MLMMCVLKYRSLHQNQNVPRRRDSPQPLLPRLLLVQVLSILLHRQSVIRPHLFSWHRIYSFRRDPLVSQYFWQGLLPVCLLL
jgi:hypothetical protein